MPVCIKMLEVTCTEGVGSWQLPGEVFKYAGGYQTPLGWGWTPQLLPVSLRARPLLLTAMPGQLA